MMKRKVTPWKSLSSSSSSGSAGGKSSSSAARNRSQSLANRRPTPASSTPSGSSSRGRTFSSTRPPSDDEEAADGDDDDDICRVRSFTTSTGVVVNRGDSFKRRGSRTKKDATTTCSGGDNMRRQQQQQAVEAGLGGPQSGKIYVSPSTGLRPEMKEEGEEADRQQESKGRPSSSSVGARYPHRENASGGGGGRDGRRHVSADDGGGAAGSSSPVYQVLVLGSQGVGKTTLTKQLLTSEYYNSDSHNAEEREEETVTVRLDDEESVIQFHDSTGFEMGKSGSNAPEIRLGASDLGKASGDGFLVVYSVTDRASFRYAQSCLQELRPAKRHNVVILVANKHDLVRKRIVQETDGIKLATKRHCKFIEVSALLDHRMDELLVGIVRQIRLRQRRDNLRPETADGDGRTESSLSETIGNFFQKIFKKEGTETGKCEDLMAP